MRSVPIINNGKKPDEPYNARLGFWLPAATPFGNFQLKLLKLSQRIDETNRRLREAFEFWHQARALNGSVPSPPDRESPPLGEAERPLVALGGHDNPRQGGP